MFPRSNKKLTKKENFLKIEKILMPNGSLKRNELYIIKKMLFLFTEIIR